MFFTQINQLMTQSVDITIVIRKSATGMTVSVLPKSNGLKDEAQNHIVPLTLVLHERKRVSEIGPRTTLSRSHCRDCPENLTRDS